MPLFLDKEEKRGAVDLIFDDRMRIKIRKKDFERFPLERHEEIEYEEYLNAVAGFQAKDAYEDALSLLDYSARTESEIKKKLLSKGYLDAVIDSVIERLKDARLIDDRQLAERIAENASDRGIGAYALKRKLKLRGISEEDVEYASSLMDEDKEKEGAKRECERLYRKYAALSVREAKAKLSAALSRRGYSWDAVSEAIESVLNDSDDYE
ncbi:MAG: RecX family transcriptional regulator [Clostridia bacterium]|nr:RecX family transcriptional regulator [Clostridia bacterium]